jgi:DMSO/TMAO reductase YedYZ molybdopterin-dependent catalytic subunit
MRDIRRGVLRIALPALLLARFCCALPPSTPAEATLTVEGAVEHPLRLTADDLAKMPHISEKVEQHGQTFEYQGVLLYDILVQAGVPFGKAMTGKPMASYLLATATDGYQVVFALPELDPAFIGNKIILADRRDGKPLPADHLPFQIIAPGEKMHARSIHSLVKLEVVRLRE